MLLKTIFSRGVVGFAFGVMVGQIVAIIISLAHGNGAFMPTTIAFASRFENEIIAVIGQNIMMGLIGTTFSAASIVFELERWGFLKQCLVHFSITAVIWIPFVYLCWMPENLKGLIILEVNFFGTYLLIWIIQYFINKNDVRKINEKIEMLNKKEGDYVRD